MTVQSTLSRRGHELAQMPDLRQKFKQIMHDPYDPDTNPEGFINIGVSENYAMLPEVADYCNKDLALPTVEFSYNQGPWGTERLRKAMAKHITKDFNTFKHVDPDDMVFSNGVTSLCEMLGFTICDPGDAVLFPTPIYQAFKWDFGAKAKVQGVYVDFGDTDQFSTRAVAKYEAALHKAEADGVRVRAILLCNPHNPLGQCYPKDTIIGLMKLCNKYKIHLLSDEIYGSSVYEVPDPKAVAFTSVLSFDSADFIDPNYVHLLYGMSKDFGAGGLRLGCMVSRNKELMRSVSAIDTFHWSGGPSMYLATRILEDDEYLDNFLNLARKRLAARNTLTRKMLDDAGINYHRGANAGFFLWIDLRPYLPRSSEFKDEWERERALMQKLIDGKVFITNGEELHSPEPGWFRVIFSQREQTIVNGLKRVIKAIGKEA